MPCWSASEVFRRRTPSISDDAWAQVRGGFGLVGELAAGDEARLRALAARFLGVKSIEPVQGLELDEAQCAAIAALACLPVLELGLDLYRGWTSVVVYPGGFVARGHDVDESGVVHEFAEPRSGESWLHGPVIVSFEDVLASAGLDGYNVVIHEMAHKLDMGNGAANGFPPLHSGMDARAWYEDFSAAFRDMNARLDAGLHVPIDAYAAESPAEFFAVTSEYFFEVPRVLARGYPAVFAQLVAYYRQDPRRRGIGPAPLSTGRPGAPGSRSRP
jgi:Mlc titration factor MtfA (ptsG expression regulator)